jgi:cytochrome b involved in lipid metabolism
MKYLMRKEVGLHHRSDDAWLIVFGRVYNVTPLIKEYGAEAEESKPLLMFAGKDVSHWFDDETEDVSNQFSM